MINPGAMPVLFRLQQTMDYQVIGGVTNVQMLQCPNQRPIYNWLATRRIIDKILRQSRVIAHLLVISPITGCYGTELIAGNAWR